MVQIGVRAHDLGRHSVDTVASFLKAQGYDTLQLVLHKLLEGFSSYDDNFDEGLLKELGASFKEQGLTVALVGCYQDVGNPNAYDKVINYFKRYAKATALVGAPFVGSETSLKDLKDEEFPIFQEHLVKLTPTLAQIAQDEGVTLLLEPVRTHPLNNVALCEKLIEKVGESKLKFIFDLANLIDNTKASKANEIVKDFFSNEAFKNNVKALHLKDFSLDEKFERTMLPLGQGLIDYAFLKEAYKSLPNLEYAIREWQDPKFVNEDLSFMRSLFD